MRTHLAAAMLLALGAGSARAQQQPTDPHLHLHGLKCSACHTAASWKDIVFDHTTTGTPLVGQHQVTPCTGCHNLRDFRTVSQQCRFCHQDPHRGDAGLMCQQCHNPASWSQIDARAAHADTRLPELGVHASLRCVDCHRQTGFQQFTGPVTPCVSCHQTTFQATNNPSHTALNFSKNCEACHQFTTWNFALFQQHDALFPIYSGTHAGKWRDCATCHVNAADYTTFTCMSSGCHAQARTDATHQGIGGYQYQATACLTCHPTGQQGTFAQHDAVFPIFTGAHAGIWSTCTQCHVDPTNPKNFTCMSSGCHVQAQTDPVHSGIAGYSYTATACLSCHPTGQGGNFTQHDALYFPIYSGTHAGTWTSCAQCHNVAGQPAQFTCMSSGCHDQATTNSNHTGIPGYSYTASACLSCHPTGQGGTFTQHDALYFPIYSGSHAGRWSSCAQCHDVANDPSQFTCMSSGCHDQATTNSNHTGVTGYQYVATACLACHPTGQGGG